MKNAIIIGASSGIGRELALQLLENGFRVGIAARRVELLEEVKKMAPDRVFVQVMDLLEPDAARDGLQTLIDQMGKVKLIVINSGTGNHDPDLDYELTKKIIGVNVTGFAALATKSYNYLAEINGGSLVGVSSIAGIRGNSYCPTYPASKAFMTTYLEGLRCKSHQENTNVKVIDIKPGFVDTAMGQSERAFWRASTDKAAKQMLNGIAKGQEQIVVSRRWYLVAWLMKWIPFKIYRNIM